MVTRAGVVLGALLLVGCPDDVAQRGAVTVEVGLRAPTSLAGAPEGGTLLRLTWDDHATNETEYRLEIDHLPFEDSIVDRVEFLPANATSFDLSTTPNTTYYFRVVAITDTLQSDPSNVLEVTTPPAAPEGVTASSNNFRQIGVAWQDVPGESGYVVERSLDASPWLEVATLPTDATSYVSEPLAPDTRVAHRVVAVSVHGRSSPSEAVMAQTVTDLVSYSYLPTAANNGLFTSLVMPDAGIFNVAHYDAESTSVTTSSRFGVLAPWVTSTADGGATGLEDVGGDGTSLAVEWTVGTPPKAHIVAHDRTANVLRYANNASGTWARTTLDLGGARPRIARDPANGALHVAYQGPNDAGQILLRLARKLPGEGWTFRSFVGFPLDPSAVLSLALDGSGRPHVLVVGANGYLVHVFEEAFGGLGSEQLPYPAAQGPPDYTALVIEPGGTIHAFHRGSLSKSLHHASRASAASGWRESIVDDGSGEDLGSYCSATFDSMTGLLHVAYDDATRGHLKCATLRQGQGWTQRIIDTDGDVGSHVSVVGVGTILYFTYRDETRKRLKIAIKPP
jgi:hypothetical protein